MKLSFLNEIDSTLSILRDVEFDTLGLMIADIDKRLLTFIEKKEYIEQLPKNIVALICTKDVAQFIPENYGVVVCDNPRLKFFEIHNLLSKNEAYARAVFSTKVGEGCQISDRAIIAKNNVVIGKNVIIEDLAIIKENTVIGDNCIIRSGAIIGGEGFEFKRNAQIDIIPVKHCGGVILKDNVEVQYNTCIDKAVYPWDDTIIGEHSKLDNLVHIGHAVKVGNRCLLAANSLIGGRTVIGDDSWVGISATVSNGLVIGEKCKVNLGAVVTRNVEDGMSVTGNFAIEHKKFIDFIKTIR